MRRRPGGQPRGSLGTGVLAAVLVAAAIVVASPPATTTWRVTRVSATSPAGACTTAALVAVNTSDAKLYRWTSQNPGAADFSGSAVVGVGWRSMRLLSVDTTDGDLFGVDTAGDLHRFTFSAGSYTGGTVVSHGWGNVDALIGAGDGVLLARDKSGVLRWYRWLNLGSRGNGWAAGSGTTVGIGWGGFRLLAGGGNGIVYGVRADNGALVWYRDRNPLDPSAGWTGPRTVGSGWTDVSQLVSVGGGHLYAIAAGGLLVHYRNLGYLTGVNSWDNVHGNPVGSGWTAAYQHLTAGPATCGRLDPPVNIRAIPGGAGIALRWNPPAGATPATYTVFRDGLAIATVSAAPANAFVDTARFVDSGLAAGAPHTYQVSMTTTQGDTTPISDAVAATLPTSTTPPPNVTVFSDFAGTEPQEAFIRQTLRDWYPVFADALVAGGYAVPSDVTVNITQNAGDNPGVTSGTTISLDWDTPGANVQDWATEPDFIGLIMHEATHVIQQYASAPTWVTEGLAVWATHNILNDADTPYPASGSYTDGYDHAAYLIRSAATWYAKPQLPADLNRTAHAGTYSDAFFAIETGHQLTSIWTTVTSPRAVP